MFRHTHFFKFYYIELPFTNFYSHLHLNSLKACVYGDLRRHVPLVNLSCHLTQADHKWIVNGILFFFDFMGKRNILENARHLLGIWHFLEHIMERVMCESGNLSLLY